MWHYAVKVALTVIIVVAVTELAKRGSAWSALLASLPASAIPGRRIELTPLETTYYLGRETLLPTGPSGMAGWRKRLFIIMARNAQTASSYFGLPPNRVVELGAQIQL